MTRAAALFANFFAVALIAAACETPTSPGVCDFAVPGAPLDATRKGQISLPAGYRATSDSAWAAMARSVPGGWGGHFLRDGLPSIYLLQPEFRAEAIVALRDHGLLLGTPAENISVVQGRWDFAQLYEWRLFIDHGLALPAFIVSRDIDETKNQITLGVLEPTQVAELAALLAAQGLPCGLVGIEVTGRVIAAEAAPAESN